MKNYYEILNIPKDATEHDIKKAFRVLSLTHHPDKSNSTQTETYHDILDAYRTLTDPVARKEHDHKCFGKETIQQPFSQTKTELSNLAYSLVPGPTIDAETLECRLNKPIPIIMKVPITLKQIYSGDCVKIDINRTVIIDNYKYEERESTYISLSKGIDDNEIIILRNQGNNINGLKGDVKIFIQYTPHPIFERKGLDLFIKKDITLKEALCGLSFDIIHISGKKYHIHNPKTHVIHPEFTKKIPNIGISRMIDGITYTGHLIIHFHVIFPESLTIEQIEMLEKALP